MLQFNEFVSTVKNVIADKTGAEVEVKEVIKNNDLIQTGLIIRTLGEKISPTIYLEQFYKKYMECEGTDVIDGICNEIIQVYNKGKDDIKMDLNIDDIADFEKIKARLYPKAIGMERNEQLLVTVPYKQIADNIAVTLFIAVNDDMSATAKVTYDLLKNWNVDYDTVLEIALENMRKVTKIQGMIEMLAERSGVSVDTMLDMLGVSADEVRDTLKDEQLVISNEALRFSAGIIADKETLNKARTRLVKDKVIILPSSIHELIIMPFDDDINIDNINSMVSEINATQLDPEEVLSDHAYIFDGNEVKPLIA